MIGGTCVDTCSHAVECTTLKSYGAVDCCRESAVIVELSKSRISASDTGSEPVSDIAVKCKVEAFCTNVRLCSGCLYNRDIFESNITGELY